VFFLPSTDIQSSVSCRRWRGSTTLATGTAFLALYLVAGRQREKSTPRTTGFNWAADRYPAVIVHSTRTVHTTSRTRNPNGYRVFSQLRRLPRMTASVSSQPREPSWFLSWFHEKITSLQRAPRSAAEHAKNAGSDIGAAFTTQTILVNDTRGERARGNRYVDHLSGLFTGIVRNSRCLRKLIAPSVRFTYLRLACV